MPGAHVFVDETKRGGLVVAAAIVAPERLQPMRGLMRGQLLKGQSHLHFTKEKDDRRGEIVTALCSSGVLIDVYQAAQSDPRKAREACLRQLVADLASTGAHRLVIEQDDSLIKSDQAVLYSAVRQAQVEHTLAYAHMPKRSEPLLWIADAAAWCWTHRGWKTRIQPIINTVRTVP
jgi:hypothetical protein